MSFHRENVIWQSKNGLWSRGFFAVAWTDYDGDPEWDVEYDWDHFNWASTGHTTEDRAHQSWDGANPGGAIVVTWSEETADECASYDRMAKEAIRNPGRGWS